MSKIQWTGITWNPIAGCSLKSTGCENCYAMKTAYKLSFNPKLREVYEGTAKKTEGGRIVWTGKVKTLPHRLEIPLKKTKPQMIFVCSMSDLFHEDVRFGFIDQVFAVMALCPRHTFQVLTKRTQRMAAYFENMLYRKRSILEAMRGISEEGFDDVAMGGGPSLPLPNVWIGTSVENEEAARHRIPLLVGIPAAVRWVSMEPLVGGVNLSSVTGSDKLDWIVVGGESGKGARPVKYQWFLSILGFGAMHGIPTFFKQAGSVYAREHGLEHSKGGDIRELPEALQVRQYPEI